MESRALAILFCAPALLSQSFDVSSVKLSQRTLGPDYRGELVFGPSSVRGRNLSLKDLIREAYDLQPRQIVGGPAWLDVSEYDVDARTDAPTPPEQLRAMLQALLADRFALKNHRDAKEMRVYALVQDKNGVTIPAAGRAAASPGAVHFRGTMRQFADLISLKLTIPAASDRTTPGIAGGPQVPVLDRTGLAGIYEFNLDLKIELGADGFTLWQRALRDQLGLKLDSRMESLPLLVIEGAEKTPRQN